MNAKTLKNLNDRLDMAIQLGASYEAINRLADLIMHESKRQRQPYVEDMQEMAEIVKSCKESSISGK